MAADLIDKACSSISLSSDLECPSSPSNFYSLKELHCKYHSLHSKASLAPRYLKI